MTSTPVLTEPYPPEFRAWAHRIEHEHDRPVRLNRREREIVAILGEHGACNKEIAYRLGVTEGTMKQYMHRLTRKTGLNRTQLALWRGGVGK